ncbi:MULTISPECIES: pyridoxal phosphate-dependent aminotransferase [Streptomyces]|uniref:pyridoxal phosphate-dependent aminotransferase n=1 Tax=Streptomyces TaxID=1883 RepID=UPI00081E781A|nr:MULTISPECIES: pyridoxal phosphate-dependent aminotransferase [unclassified Streptomyces]MBJ6998626.1 pyridoxal phosphate-dependent aminotransferase [Streptomyces sp. CRPSP2-6A1]MYQ94392.1 aminotransferase class I/II-fold pyridoxal phosphate-dependent enzyme [Streptomyces sp. SID4946]SCF88677.1 N-succinyldiaminopimelate aminotransferase [Streptomyces sp. DconLS]SCF90182.1 N-succinyldiaminopimelate aminotransferase [Streptomyces sp. LamerLS-31b]
MEPTRLVLDSGELPNDHEDAGLIRQYEERGGDIRRLIYLSLGETWNAVAPGLAAVLASGLPVHSHGYTLSPYGLPALRDVLRDYVRRTHRLPQAGTETYDVAVSQSGTRAAMSDFGRLLLTDARTPDTAPAALVPSPGWDYGGVLAPLGYRLLPYDLGAVRGWQPDPAEIESLLDSAGHWSLVVLNPQHNPTGANWAPETVRAIVEAAVARRAAILLDDAYYALYTPGQLPTNALRILVEETQGSTVPWLATRTLGKQFHCNGWGIGALTARPATLAGLARVMHARSYGCALPLQAAMASWLRTEQADDFVERLRGSYAAARGRVSERLRTDLGFPSYAVHPGTCSAYLRFRVPTRYVHEGSEARYRRLCLQAGVLPGAGSMTGPRLGPRRRRDPSEAYVRLFLAQPGCVLDEALDRLARAGLGW